MTTPTTTPDEGQVADPVSPANLIDQSLKTWRQRLADLDKEIKPLADEADILRSAILKVERSQQPNASAARARSGTRERVLAAITDQAKTAGEISNEIGIPTGTVSSALRALTKDGQAAKAAHGYRATPG